MSPRTKSRMLGTRHALPTRSHRVRPLIAFLVLSIILWMAPALCRAQGTWHQNEFVIGSWNDPIYSDDTLMTRHAYQQAKDAYFNLLTGTVNHYYGSHWTDPYSPGSKYTSLTMAGELGLHVLLSDPRFTSGCCGYTAPAFDPSVPPGVLALYDDTGSDALSTTQNNALWGYDLWDEPAWTSGNADFVKSWASAMHANDVARNDGHSRAVYLNLFAGCGDYTCYPSYLAPFVSDPDPNRQIDAVSTDLYPFSGPTSNPTYPGYYFNPMRDLRAAMGSRPFWIITTASELEVGGNASLPDENQFRFMAFCPTAAGAKGVIWFLYRGDGPNRSDEVVNYQLVPTCKYYQLKTINHFLHDVVGPVAMNSDHLGIWHQSSQPSNEPYLTLLSDDVAQVCPASNLGNANFLVGVFRPTAQPSDYYLLIVNKALTPQTSTVTLRNSYTVTQSPSVVGYVGGTSYTPVTTGSSFAVSLAGGEGRLFRLTGAATQDIALTTSLDGQLWLPGTQRQITWQANGQPVDVTVYADPQENSPEISGPSATLGTGLTGSSATLTMPNLVTNHARLVISSTGTDGVLRRVSHAQPFRTAPSPGQPMTDYSVGPGRCYMESDLTVGADGVPHVFFRDQGQSPIYSKFDGTSWQSENVWAGYCLMPSITTDYHGVPDMVFADMFLGSFLHTVKWNQGSAWYTTGLPLNVGTPSGNTSMARGGDGYMYLFLNTSSYGGYRLALYRSYYGELWQPYAVSPISAVDPRSISAGADATTAWVAFVDGLDTQTALKVLNVPISGPVTSLSVTGAYRRVSLVIDAAGNPLIAYSRAIGTDGSSGLYYRASSGGVWGSEVPVDVSPGTIQSVALALSNGVPRIAYVGNGVAKYALQVGSSWLLDVLDSPNDISGPAKLSFAPNGKGWASWFDRTLGSLRVGSFTPDIIPPATISLNGGGGCYNFVVLSWTAPGDDGTTGTATAYDLRWSASAITDANFGGATPIATGSPLPAGSQEQLTLSVPYCSHARYYAIKARDEVNNWSALSNVAYAGPACPRPPAQCFDDRALPAPQTEPSDLPTVLELSRPAPNPISTQATQFRFGVPANLAGAEYDLGVFDLVGRRVATVVQGQAAAGYHTVTWDLRSQAGTRVAGGMYFVRLRLGSALLTQRVITVR